MPTAFTLARSYLWDTTRAIYSKNESGFHNLVDDRRRLSDAGDGAFDGLVAEQEENRAPVVLFHDGGNRVSGLL